MIWRRCPGGYFSRAHGRVAHVSIDLEAGTYDVVLCDAQSYADYGPSPWLQTRTVDTLAEAKAAAAAMLTEAS